MITAGEIIGKMKHGPWPSGCSALLSALLAAAVMSTAVEAQQRLRSLPIDEPAPASQPQDPFLARSANASAAPAPAPQPQYSSPAVAGRQIHAGIHPAVARVSAAGQDSISYGTGTLVAVNNDHGLVITNWHVINEATGSITVEFADGFRSPATVTKVDKDWDLAALAIWKPRAMPVPLATRAPAPGDPLTIAGYGSGAYRAVTGACTQYVAPGLTFPYEMVELSASARQGDSGGPIFNSAGELAGVLFGEGNGRTAGSYCGRVEWFITSVTGGGHRDQGAMLAASNAAPAAGWKTPARLSAQSANDVARRANGHQPSVAPPLPMAPLDVAGPSDLVTAGPDFDSGALVPQPESEEASAPGNSRLAERLARTEVTADGEDVAAERTLTPSASFTRRAGEGLFANTPGGEIGAFLMAAGGLAVAMQVLRTAVRPSSAKSNAKKKKKTPAKRYVIKDDDDEDDDDDDEDDDD